MEELASGKDGFFSSPEFQRSVLLLGCGGSSSSKSAPPTPAREPPNSSVESGRRQSGLSMGTPATKTISNGRDGAQSAGVAAGQQEVIDLTCDSPVRAPSPQPQIDSDDNRRDHSSSKTDTATPLRTDQQLASCSSSAIPSVSATAVGCPVDLSRSRVMFLLASLLDELTFRNDYIPNTSSSSSSSSSARMAVHNVSDGDIRSAECARMIQLLRPAVARLLLLEVNVTKFYPNVSSPQLLYLARKLDIKLIHTTEAAALHQQTAPPSSSNGEDCVFAFPNAFLRLSEVIARLEAESRKLERGLYKLSGDGHMVPAIFRRPKLGCFERALASRIDTDGIEMVENTGNQSSSSAGSSIEGKSASGAVWMDSDEHYFSNSSEGELSEASSYHSSDDSEAD